MTKSESARINGAKSRGPVTEAGRRRSSQNALKHGLTAQTILLPSEDPDEFHQLLASYIRQFQPDGPVELDLVHDMVAAKWRLQRLALIETQLFIESMEHAEDRADTRLTPIESLTTGFERMVQDNTLAFLHRAESRLERTYSRALRNLLQLQKLRRPTDPPSAPPPDEETCKNEPTDPLRPNGYIALQAETAVTTEAGTPSNSPGPAAEPNGPAHLALHRAHHSSRQPVTPGGALIKIPPYHRVEFQPYGARNSSHRASI